MHVSVNRTIQEFNVRARLLFYEFSSKALRVPLRVRVPHLLNQWLKGIIRLLQKDVCNRRIMPEQQTRVNIYYTERFRTYNSILNVILLKYSGRYFSIFHFIDFFPFPFKIVPRL